MTIARYPIASAPLTGIRPSQQTAQTVTVACSATAAFVKRGNKTVVTALSGAVAFGAREIARIVAVAAACTVSIRKHVTPSTIVADVATTVEVGGIRAQLQDIVVACTTTCAAILTAGKAVSASIVASVGGVRSVGKNVSAACSTTTQVVKSAGSIVISSVTSAVDSAVEILRGQVIDVACTATVVALKSAGQIIALLCTDSVAVVKQSTTVVEAAASTVADVIKRATAVVASACTTASSTSAIKARFVDIAISCATSVSIARSALAGVAVTCAVSVAQFVRALFTTWREAREDRETWNDH